MIPWIKCKIFGDRWRITTIQTTNYEDENDSICETMILKNCICCKRFRPIFFLGKMSDKEIVDLIESYEDN